MKALVISSHTPSLFIFRLDMMKSFQELGYDVVAAGPGSMQEWRGKFEEFHVQYYPISVSRNGLNPYNDIKTILCLWDLLRRIQPDKIFVYQAKTVAYSCIAAKMCSIAEVYPMIAGLGSIFRGTGFKNRIVKEVMSVLYRNAFKCSQKVFFQNEDDIQEVLHHHLIDKEKVVKINGSGVNLAKFQVVPLPCSPAFLYVGRLIRDKGIGEYLEACKKIKILHPEVRCLLVGAYDSNPSSIKPQDLQPYVEHGIIEYFGEQLDVRPFIGQCTTLVLPSYHEGTPKAVLEAMAMGRSILTSDAPGCRETVIDGKNGFLVPVRDIVGLVEKMEYLISHMDIIAGMGKTSRQIAEDKFNVSLVNRVIADTMGII